MKLDAAELSLFSVFADFLVSNNPLRHGLLYDRWFSIMLASKKALEGSAVCLENLEYDAH